MEGSFVVSRKYENKLDIKTRKERGIYYTPYVVVKYILDNTIGKHDIVQNPYPKILDMSCGCGNFLIQAYTMLYKKFYDNIDK
ncbi:MAG: N-6 DNA methylase [Intestinibacter sp.]